jgi:hypothetical protein
MAFHIPQSLKSEHEQLHSTLMDATRLSGKTSERAKEVARLMHPHFLKEEEYVLPPLGLLPALAQGQTLPEMKSALAMTTKLKSELPTMLEEHTRIVAALNELTLAARAEGHPDVVAFGEDLMAHARTEEEVMYPAAILIGEYLKLRLGMIG